MTVVRLEPKNMKAEHYFNLAMDNVRRAQENESIQADDFADFILNVGMAHLEILLRSCEPCDMEAVENIILRDIYQIKEEIRSGN